MFTAEFWLATVERAVKTFAQSLAALLGADGLDVLNAPWQASLAVAGLAALLSVLTSVASAPAGPPNSPALVGYQPKHRRDEAGESALGVALTVLVVVVIVILLLRLL